MAIKYFLLLTVLLLTDGFVKAGEQLQPTSQGAATVPEKEPPTHTELVLRLGNESNPVDGPLGPFTYGLRGSHTFENKMALEVGYILLHEPYSPQFDARLDEGQLTFKLPETSIISQPVTIAATAWSNRLIDMYTNVGGLEFTRSGRISVSLGAYLGSATREDVHGGFQGAQLTVSGAVGPLDISAACMGGKIDSGAYRHAALELSHDFFSDHRIPVALTFAAEERYFDFGNGGPASQPEDEFIFVTGIEIHFEKLTVAETL